MSKVFVAVRWKEDKLSIRCVNKLTLLPTPRRTIRHLSDAKADDLARMDCECLRVVEEGDPRTDCCSLMTAERKGYRQVVSKP